MKSLLKLLPYLKPYWSHLLLSCLLAIPLSALRFSPAPMVKYLVDEVLATKDSQKLVYFPLLIIGIFVLNFVVRFFHYYLLRVVIARVNQRIKNDLFTHFLGLSSDYFTQQSTGNLISRVVADTQYVDGGVSTINVLVREPLTFLCLLGFVVYLDWRLTLITFLIFPALMWLFSVTGRNLKRYISRLNEQNAELYSTLQESFSGIRVVKIFGLNRYVRRRFRQQTERYVRILFKTGIMEEAAHPMVELITAFSIALVIYFGGLFVLNNQMTSGDLLAFFTGFAMMLNPIRMMNDVNIKLNQAAAACDRIFTAMEWKTHIVEADQPKRVSGLSKGIEFSKVDFCYLDAPERKVLHSISFFIPKGKVTALVGASGSGKSSIANLLCRVFDVSSGEILLDGVNIKKIALRDLRNLISVVSQDVFLFNDTIRENIRCGRLTATRDEVVEAAKQADAYDFIQTLPQKFETIVGDRGAKLSGGERQRLSIARAFLRRSPILVLDEATSNLDTESERSVQESLEDLMEDRTSLVIAHRLSTIRTADQIIVMKEGRIVERGVHSELMVKQGEYSKYYSLQSD